MLNLKNLPQFDIMYLSVLGSLKKSLSNSSIFLGFMPLEILIKSGTL